MAKIWLYWQLRSNKTDAVGTVRINKKNMPTQLKKKLKRWEIVACVCTELLAMKWMDKCQVYMLSTIHDAAMTMVKTCHGFDVQKTVVTYKNRLLYLADQMLTAYSTERKHSKICGPSSYLSIIARSLLLKRCNVVLNKPPRIIAKKSNDQCFHIPYTLNTDPQHR